jgi:hypothetical protein
MGSRKVYQKTPHKLKSTASKTRDDVSAGGVSQSNSYNKAKVFAASKIFRIKNLVKHVKPKQQVANSKNVALKNLNL